MLLRYGAKSASDTRPNASKELVKSALALISCEGAAAQGVSKGVPVGVATKQQV
jgi:hypothetical protein